MRMGVWVGLMVALGLFIPVGAAQAAITVVHQWNLGEDDLANTVPGTASATTVDAVGGANLNLTGAPGYIASGVPGGGSTHAVNFSNSYGPTDKGSATQYYSSDFNYTPTNSSNWGMEAWVRFNSLPEFPPQQEAAFVHLGTSAGGSLGLQTSLNNGEISWTVHAPAITLVRGSAVEVGEWTHVAAVVNGGALQLYINGTLAASQAGVGGLNPPASVTLGAWVDGSGPLRVRGIDGAIDVVRVFEFQPGEFSIDDTLFAGVPVPEPTGSVLAMLGAAGLACVRRRRSRR